MTTNISCSTPHRITAPAHAQPCTVNVTQFPNRNTQLCGRTSDIQTFIVRGSGENQWVCERHLSQTLVDAWATSGGQTVQFLTVSNGRTVYRSPRAV